MQNQATQNIHFLPFDPEWIDHLIDYLNNLSLETQKRFGPHAFTRQAVLEKYNNPSQFKLYLSINKGNEEIIAYTIVKLGWLDFDRTRLSSYGLHQEKHDCTVAPSVADQWQGRGIGSVFFNFLVDQLITEFKIRRIILWGGVQADNNKAIGFYKKLGFRKLGEFNHNGKNFDMILELGTSSY